ncbi:family 1 glycosylhydrolase [Isoptericola hypogeus]|uniref:Family 1 glycosylhydrolase n=1 Tax=Isoptericola hypogeus TaxID=300179 RepID=A0ABN2JX05_9MICO
MTRTFLWGAATSAHQVEGNNVNSDWWQIEQVASGIFEASGDAIDSYHRYREEMELLAGARVNTYRFSVEWARIEPLPGRFSRAELDHYRRMIDEALRLGLTPMVTLHHFSHPQWFVDRGGWLADDSAEIFARYCDTVCEILEGVDWVCTINEPNVLAFIQYFHGLIRSGAPLPPRDEHARPPLPDIELGRRLVEAHHAAREVVRRRTRALVGWSVAGQAFTPTDGNESTFAEVKYAWEDFYYLAARGDDYVGVQSYTSQAVDADGPVPHADAPDNTLTGWAYRPDALEICVRNAAEVTCGVPIVVTENGIATADDDVRIAYTKAALAGLYTAMNDGIDVRGYIHWSAVDNFEWGHWRPTFGLIAVDRETFERTPKPSLHWFGAVADRGPSSSGERQG